MKQHKDKLMTHTIERIAASTLGVIRRVARRPCRLTAAYILLDDGDVFYRATGRRKVPAAMRGYGTTYVITVDIKTLQEGV